MLTGGLRHSLWGNGIQDYTFYLIDPLNAKAPVTVNTPLTSYLFTLYTPLTICEARRSAS